MTPSISLIQKEIEFYQPLVAAYLKYGSVDKVFAQFKENPGVSYAHFQRILQRWGIIKSAGSHGHMAEIAYFFSALAKNNIPLETLYKTMPPSLKISAASLHRVLSYIKRGITRRTATALIITVSGDPVNLLVGKDISTPRPEIGKLFGSISLPMTFSRRTETPQTSIYRVLQQEVFSNLALMRKLPHIVPPFQLPIMSIDVTDVRVYVYSLSIPVSLKSKLNSFKLTDYQFVTLEDIAKNTGFSSPFRAGIPEIATALLERNQSLDKEPIHLNSILNHQLATLPVYE